MDNSDLEISGDWHVVSSIHSEEKEKISVTGAGDRSTKENENEIFGESSRVQDIGDPECAACNESSSSDIDIIDENVDDREEAVTSCFLPSSSLTISTSSSTVEKPCDTYSAESATSLSESVSAAQFQSKENDELKSEDAETHDSNARNENANHDTATPWTIGGRPLYDWVVLFLEFLQNLSGFQWSCVFGLTMCLYFCITINQTNIIALQENESVVSQLERMIDELRNDNKQLKEQMLSEMKNDKLVSSFEHQIRELKKENSKLNHMMYDVVKVLEKQKDTQEKLLTKKEADYQAPFKKEINKLKEHINMLKFDNEELQKQLVRMRYASYSQGGKHADTKDKKEYGKENNEKNTHEKEAGGWKGNEGHDRKGADMKDEKVFGTEKSETETGEKKDFSNDQPLELEQLKKWNELLDLVIKELGIFDKEILNPDEQQSDSKSEEEKDWSWQDEFKGIFINLPHIHVSEVVTRYAKSYEKMFSKIYKSASSYFAGAQENAQSFIHSFKDKDKNSERNIKMWSIINNLGERWAHMKKKVLSSYQKFNYPPAESNFEKPDDFETVQEDSTSEEIDKSEEHIEMPEMNWEEIQKFAKDKWLFKRADYRAKLRENVDDGDSVNWFLKKKRREGDADFISTDEDPIEDYTVKKEKKKF